MQWLSGRPYTVILALVYGYMPFFIVPLYATLDRIDGRLLDASRDLGVGGVRTFLHVTLPLSRQGLLTACVVTALPMFGDYYTNTLVSGSPRTTMVGNQIELYLLGGSRQDMGASLVLIMSAMLMVLMAYYLISSQRADRQRVVKRRPVFLAALTWLYVVWSLAPVLLAIQFSFNAGRSRSTWQGFSTRWYCCDPSSVVEDPSLRLALLNSVVLALLTTLVATPLGVALALGLARWRGRVSRAANGLMLIPLATPELVLGSALFLVFTNLYTVIPLGRPAQVLGHVTFSISYVVVIVRARLASIGPEFEAAARDLGATRLQAVRTVLLPLLYPAVVAGALIVFASSMDDFVVSAFLSVGRVVGDRADPALLAWPAPRRRRRSTLSRRCCWSAPRSPSCWRGWCCAAGRRLRLGA